MKVSNMNNINIAREWTRVMLIGKIPSIFFTLTSQISQLVTVDVVFRNSVQSNNQLKLNNNSDTLLMHFKLLECEILKLFSTNVIKFHCLSVNVCRKFFLRILLSFCYNFTFSKQNENSIDRQWMVLMAGFCGFCSNILSVLFSQLKLIYFSYLISEGKL